jgi:putative peptide zinc metalloprotease protein
MIGAGLYLVWPVFFNDIDDSYRLGRRGRLRADLGGIYFNAVFSVILGTAFLLVGFAPLVVAAAVQHLVVVQQFLPFVRLDGYYVVSDLAGVPNLFARIRPILGSLVPGRSATPAVSGLRPGARALVTAWVIVTVAVMGAFFVFVVVHLPDIAGSMAHATNVQTESLLAAWRVRSPWVALVDLLQLGLILVPPTGILLTLWQAARLRLRARS